MSFPLRGLWSEFKLPEGPLPPMAAKARLSVRSAAKNITAVAWIRRGMLSFDEQRYQLQWQWLGIIE